MEVLFELNEELNRLFIAGSRLAPGDPRLTKFSAPLRKYGEKAPVFLKLAQLVEELSNISPENSAAKLIETESFLLSVLSTQGQSAPGDDEIIIDTDSDFKITVKTEFGYRTLSPVIKALNTTGGGRLTIIKQAFEEGKFKDWRLWEIAAGALSDKFAEIAEFAANSIVPDIGMAVYSLIRKKYDVKGTIADGRRLSVMCALDKKQAALLIDEALNDGSAAVKAEAVKLMGASNTYEKDLLKMLELKKPSDREKAMQSLITMDSKEGIDRIMEIFQSEKANTILELISCGTGEYLTAKLLKKANDDYEKFKKMENAEKKELNIQKQKLFLDITALKNKQSNEIYGFLKKILADSGLDTLEPDALGVLYGSTEGNEIIWQKFTADMENASAKMFEYAFSIGVKKLGADEFYKVFYKADLWQKYPKVFSYGIPFEVVKILADNNHPAFGKYGYYRFSGEQKEYLMQKEAEYGDAGKKFDLAYAYEFGKGVPKSLEKCLEWYKKAAEQGHKIAQYNLAQCYYFGKGAETDMAEGIKWYLLAAEQNYSSAERRLGTCYKEGKGVEQNFKKMVEWYTKAADHGDIETAYLLAKCYKDGTGVTKDFDKAVELYTKAANQGHLMSKVFLAKEMDDTQLLLKAAEKGDASAQYYLGKYYYDKNNYKKAVEWLSKSAMKGDKFAQYRLGVAYENGRGVPQDYKKAVEWFNKSYENGFNSALLNLGNMYFDGQGVKQDYNKAVELYTKLAEQGSDNGQNSLGRCYHYGYGVEQSYEKAIEWWKKAAEQGNEVAMTNIGNNYYNGRGVPLDYDKAAEWWMKGAEKGDSTGQSNIGTCYALGRGKPQDTEKAIEWYSKAAEQNNEGALFDLGMLYENGIGIKKDFKKAAMYFEKAAINGCDEALGVCYLKGYGYEKDEKKAFKIFSEAAKNPNAEEAINFLGECYLNGTGVKSNHKKAAELFEASIKIDANSPAFYNMGLCYLNGLGVEKNMEKAKEYLQKAADYKLQDAVEKLAEMQE